MFRSRKLLDAARGQDCMVQIPHICNHNPETVVAAHSNWYEHGKGKGMKAHDCFVAWACSSCHNELDQGTRLIYEEKKEYWRRGFENTLLAMCEKGILKT